MQTVGDRIKERLGAMQPTLSQAGLASAIGMTPDAMSRALNGQRQFAAIELARIADRLSTSMYWLATGEPDPNAARVAARHTFNHVAGHHESVDWAAERRGLETVSGAYTQVFSGGSQQDLPALPSDAAEARSRLMSIRSDFVRHFAETVEEAFGVEVVRVPEVKRGFSMDVVGHRVIIVPPHPNWFYQNWSIAHELGHFVTGRLQIAAEATPIAQADEVLANAFAAELLLPAAELRAIDWLELDAASLATFLWDTGVSTDAVKRRLASLQIVPGDSIRELLMLPTQRVLRRHLVSTSTHGVDAITDRMERAGTVKFPSKILSAHTAAVSDGEIGADYLAWMLRVDPRELEAEMSPSLDAPDFDAIATELGFDPGPR